MFNRCHTFFTRHAKCIINFLDLRAVLLLILLAYGVLSLSFIVDKSASFYETLSKYTCDEYAFLNIIKGGVAAFCTDHYIPWGAFYSHSYGFVYWVISMATALPGYLLGSDKFIVVSLRMLSMLASLMTIFFLWQAFFIRKVIKSFFILVVLHVLALPIIFYYSCMVHPETIYCFFMAFSFYALCKDDGQFGRFFYFSIVLFCAAVSVKLLAFLFGIIFFVYFWQHWPGFTVFFRKIIRSGILAFFVFIFLNFPLLLHPILTKNMTFVWSVFNNFMNASELMRYSPVALANVPSYFEKITLFSSWYGSWIGMLLLLITGSFIGVFGKTRQSFCFNGALVVCWFYFIFVFFWPREPYHYAISLAFFLIPLFACFLRFAIEEATKFQAGVIWVGLIISLTGSLPAYTKTLTAAISPSRFERFGWVIFTHEDIKNSNDFLQKLSGTHKGLRVGISSDLWQKIIELDPSLKSIALQIEPFEILSRDLIEKIDGFLVHKRTAWKYIWLYGGRPFAEAITTWQMLTREPQFLGYAKPISKGSISYFKKQKIAKTIE